jgi:hypothetical protein
VFVVVRGCLMVSEELAGGAAVRRAPERLVPDVLLLCDAVRHQVHNRGDHVGLSVHIFGN